MTDRKLGSVDELRKAKYTRRWRGSDGRYRYEYAAVAAASQEKFAEAVADNVAAPSRSPEHTAPDRQASMPTQHAEAAAEFLAEGAAAVAKLEGTGRHGRAKLQMDMMRIAAKRGNTADVAKRFAAIDKELAAHGRGKRAQANKAARDQWASPTATGEKEVAEAHGFTTHTSVNEEHATQGRPAKRLHVKIPDDHAKRLTAISLRGTPGTPSQGHSAFAHRSPKEEGKWQTSRFSGDAKPVGDATHGKVQPALDSVRKDGFHVDDVDIKDGPAQADIEVDKAKILAGNLGIPRIKMPQIPAPLIGKFIEDLKAKGVKADNKAIPTGQLRATQSEINPAKVKKMVSLGEKFLGDPSKTILVSKDGFVLDGHHRWAALRALDPSNKINTIQIDLPIKKLLAASHEFEGVEYQKALRRALDLVKATQGALQPVHTTMIQPAWKRMPGAATMLRNRAHRQGQRDPEQKYLEGLYTARGMPPPKVNISEGGPYLAGRDVVKGLGLDSSKERDLSLSIDRLTRGAATELTLRKGVANWRFDHPDLDPALRSELGRRTLSLFREKRRQEGDFIVKSQHSEPVLILSSTLIKGFGGNRESSRGVPARSPMTPKQERKAMGRPQGNTPGKAPPKSSPPPQEEPPQPGGPDQQQQSASLDTGGLDEQAQSPDHIQSKLRMLRKELNTLHEHISSEGQVHMHNDIVEKMRDVHANPTASGLESVLHAVHHFSEMVQGPEMGDGSEGADNGGAGEDGGQENDHLTDPDNPLSPPKATHGGGMEPDQPEGIQDVARKALVLDLDLIKGAALPVGTHRTWGGDEFVKMPTGEWEPAPGSARAARPEPGSGERAGGPEHPALGSVFQGKHDQVINKDQMRQDRKSPDDAVARSTEKMKDSLASGKGKRDPIEVHKVNQEDGGSHYRVRDGNTTFQALQKNGWENFPVKVTKEVNEKDYKPIAGHERSTPEEKEAKARKAHDKARKLETEKEQGRKAIDAAKSTKSRDAELKGLSGKKEAAFREGHKRMASLSASEHEQIAEGVADKHSAALQRGLFELRELAGPKANVDGRTKTIGSMVGKVARKPKYGDATKLDDATGMRVIHQTIDECKSTLDKIKKKYKVLELEDFIDNKREGGYRSAHVIIQDENGLRKELQIRTENEHFWAEWCHDVYKPQNPEQYKAKKENGPEIDKFAETLSDHYYSKDNGDDPPDPPAPNCAAVIASAFGCPPT